MNEKTRMKLISLASDFVSFLIPRANIDKAILYGSVAENTFDEESDVDLFVETDKKNHKKVEKLLELYKKSEKYKKLELEGIENEISVKCGKLEDWKGLKRSIISNGLVLYGKYSDEAEKLKHKILFMVDFTNKQRAEKIKVWRKVYGYRQKVGKKVYISEGLAERKLGRGAFISTLENFDKVKEYLKKNRVKYELLDVWME